MCNVSNSKQVLLRDHGCQVLLLQLYSLGLGLGFMVLGVCGVSDVRTLTRRISRTKSIDPVLSPDSLTTLMCLENPLLARRRSA